MTANIVAQGSDLALLSGSLNLKTVGGLLTQGNLLIAAAQQEWTLDMSAVEGVSSAGAALLVEWLKQSTVLKKPFYIKNFPESLRPILEVSDLMALFTPLLRPEE